MVYKTCRKLVVHALIPAFMRQSQVDLQVPGPSRLHKETLPHSTTTTSVPKTKVTCKSRYAQRSFLRPY